MRLKITDWREGMRKIPLTKLLQAKLDLPLRNAKAIVDGVLDGKQQIVDIPEGVDPERLLEEVRNLGADAELE
jgi:hypothetical protein